jgi:hypothetical protein
LWRNDPSQVAEADDFVDDHVRCFEIDQLDAEEVEAYQLREEGGLLVVRGRVWLNWKFESVNPVLDGLKAGVDTIRVSMEEFGVLICEIDGPVWVLDNPLRFAGSSQESRLSDEDAGVEGQAFKFWRPRVANDDVEGVLKVVTGEL